MGHFRHGEDKMDIDRNAFFRKATLRICGNLEAEAFLEDCYRYLAGIIPLERMALSYYDPEKGKQTILAEASQQGGKLVREVLIQPKRIRPYAARHDLETLVIDRADTHPTAQSWIRAGRLKGDASLMVMRVFVRSDIIGAVIFVAPECVRFTPTHENLINLLRKPFAIALSNCVRYQELLELKNMLSLDYQDLQNDFIESAGQDIVGARFGLKPVMELVRQVAPLSSPVLLLGETGTGKELFAAAIHNLSPRSKGPFIKVNCGAIPESLIDSELFGHEKGAFTGALTQKRGRFERADGGTIFLDEIGELRPEVQVRLLRVLQEKEIERVGGKEPLPVDIRIIAATHRDLETMLEADRFRQDLYFRLKVFPILIPPLRERRGDIPSLVDYFMERKYRELGLADKPGLAPGAMSRLKAYDWPGNVRELENTVERALILSRGRNIAFNDAIDLPSTCDTASTHISNADSAALNEQSHLPPLDQVIVDHITKALNMAKGQVGGKSGAAKRLGVNPSTLRKKMRKLGIPYGRAVKSKQERNKDIP
jgi:transcriptional regulator with GAF, ATPase, and Fis domain